jgi:hypothetical protein
MYNQLYYVENTIINTYHKGMLENKVNAYPKSYPKEHGDYPCNAAAPLTISVNSVVMAACLALL